MNHRLHSGQQASLNSQGFLDREAPACRDAPPDGIVGERLGGLRTLAGTAVNSAQKKPTGRPASDNTIVERFERTRLARAAALLEDYVELISDLAAEFGEVRIADIARRLGVTQPTAAKALTRMKRDGLVVARPYRGVFLTEAGVTLASRVKTRHQVVLTTLKALGVPDDAAEADAEGIEHYVSDETLRAFQLFLRQKVSR